MLRSLSTHVLLLLPSNGLNTVSSCLKHCAHHTRTPDSHKPND
jgi:hypothetical protein